MLPILHLLIHFKYVYFIIYTGYRLLFGYILRPFALEVHFSFKLQFTCLNGFATETLLLNLNIEIFITSSCSMNLSSRVSAYIIFLTWSVVYETEYCVWLENSALCTSVKTAHARHLNLNGQLPLCRGKQLAEVKCL